MAVSNDIPWLGFLTADIRGARAPDAPVCSAAGREGDADKTGPTAIPTTCSTYLFYLPGCPVRPMEGSTWGQCSSATGPCPATVFAAPLCPATSRTARGKQLAFPETHHHCSPSFHLSPASLILPYFPAVSALRLPRRLCRPRQCGAGLSHAPREHAGDALGRRRGATNGVFLSEVFKHATIKSGLIFFYG